MRGDTTVAVGGEGTGEALRLVINRQPIRRHDPQRRPSAYNLQIAQPRERQHRAARDCLHHGRLLAGVETGILLAVAERTRQVLPLPIATIRQTVEGSIMLGDSQEDAGFDTSQRPAVMRTIARRAVLAFPWLRDLQIVRAWAALRVMPPDGLPIYDQSEQYPGAFTANCHSGVTLAGAHANLFAPMVAAGELDPALERFSARRFDVPAAA